MEPDEFMDAKLRAYFEVLFSRELPKGHVLPESEEEERTGTEVDKF